MPYKEGDPRIDGERRQKGIAEIKNALFGVLRKKDMWPEVITSEVELRLDYDEKNKPKPEIQRHAAAFYPGREVVVRSVHVRSDNINILDLDSETSDGEEMTLFTDPRRELHMQFTVDPVETISLEEEKRKGTRYGGIIIPGTGNVHKSIFTTIASGTSAVSALTRISLADFVASPTRNDTAKENTYSLQPMQIEVPSPVLLFAVASDLRDTLPGDLERVKVILPKEMPSIFNM